MITLTHLENPPPALRAAQGLGRKQEIRSNATERPICGREVLEALLFCALIALAFL